MLVVGHLNQKVGLTTTCDYVIEARGRGLSKIRAPSGRLKRKGQLLMTRVTCSAVALLVLLGGVSHAQVGNREDGLALAQQVCSECHAIRAGQGRSPNSRSPPFSELATTPGMTSIALTVALTTPHAGMPMFMLTAEQREDIIAYILSLKGVE